MNPPTRKKVLIITYYWPPSGGAGVQRWLKFSKYLPEMGIDPVILSVDPAKASYPVLDPGLSAEIPDSVKVYRTPSREILNLLQKLYGRSGVPYGGFANKRSSFSGPLGRWIRGNFFIPDPRKGWNKYAIIKGREIIKKEQIDAIITSSPPHSTHLIGMQLKLERKLPWIVDLRDPWTDIFYFRDLLPMRGSIKKQKRMERSVLENADKIITVGHSFKKLFLEKSKQLPEEKIEVIHNGFDEEDFVNGPDETSREFVITYTGTLTNKYGLEGFIDVFSALVSSGEIKAKIRFIGSSPAALKTILNSAGGTAVAECIDHVPHARAIKYTQSAGTLLLGIPKVPANTGIIPGKLFEYMKSGRPIILIGPVQSDAARIVAQCSAGYSYDYNDRSGMKKGLLQLYQAWLKGSEYSPDWECVNQYSRKTLTSKLVRLINLQI